MKRTNINVLIVAMLMLCAALSMGCVDNQEVPIEPTEEQTRTPEPTPLVEAQYDDTEYLRCTLISTRVTLTYIDGIIESIEIYDFERLEVLGKGLQTHSTITLKELSAFNISPSLQPSDKEYTMFLKSMYRAGQQVEKIGKYHNTKYLEQLVQYVQEATDHLERSTELLPNDI